MTRLERIIKNLTYLYEHMEESENKEILRGELQSLEQLEELAKQLI